LWNTAGWASNFEVRPSSHLINQTRQKLLISRRSAPEEASLKLADPAVTQTKPVERSTENAIADLGYYLHLVTLHLKIPTTGRSSEQKIGEAGGVDHMNVLACSARLHNFQELLA
jgi:hypothetical protein